MQMNNETNEIVHAIAMLAINDKGADMETPYKEYLKSEMFDFSLESLKYIDEYLNKLRKKVKLLTDEQFTKVILRCGAYCGEVIRLNSKIKFEWMTFDEAMNIFEQLSQFGKSTLTYYVLTSNEGNSVTFPMAKVEKYLNYGMQESLYTYAQVIGKF